MRVAHFTTLTASGESEALGFKETTGTRREAAMTVCAFLNQGGGQVLIGLLVHKADDRGRCVFKGGDT